MRDTPRPERPSRTRVFPSRSRGGLRRNASSIVIRAMSFSRLAFPRTALADALVKDALKGMVSGLDPHSSYLDAKEYSDFQSTTRGEFAGIGAELARDGARIRIITPIDDTPAARGGVRPGDIIERVNGEAID